MDKRPEGHRLLQDAAAGRFGCVLFYRISRLGRRLSVILDAHDQLGRFAVTLRSATEPLNTSDPVGRFLFQLLGSMAELDRETMQEQLNRGRDRVARVGRWTDGPIPYGYQLDKAGCLIPSTRLIDKVKMTESAIVQDLFQREAAGRTTSVAEASRFNALEIPTTRYHTNGTVRKAGQRWYPARIVQMIASPTYKGTHIYKNRFGAIEREVPSLEGVVWDDCRGFIRNPGQALAEAQRQLQERQRDVTRVELERSTYHKALIEKAKARDDILLLVRRGAIALNDAQSHLTDIAHEEDTIRGQLTAIDAQRALVNAHAAHIQDAQRMLERLHTRLQEIETAEAQEDIKRQVIEMLVREICINTHPDRSLSAKITYAFSPAHVAYNFTTHRL